MRVDEKFQQENFWENFWEDIYKKKTCEIKWKLHMWYLSLKYSKLWKGLKFKRVLELGGGSGYLGKLLVKRFSFDLTVVDPSKQAYKVWEKYSKVGAYINCDAFEYKPKERFDLVFSSGVAEHFKDKKERLKFIKLHKEFSKRYISISVPRKTWYIEKFFHLDPKLGYEKLYKEGELESEIEDVGIKVLKVTRDLQVVAVLGKK